MGSKNRSSAIAPILPGLPGAGPGKVFVRPPESVRPGEPSAWCDPKTGKVIFVDLGYGDIFETKCHRSDLKLKDGDRGLILAPMLKVGKRGNISSSAIHPTELRSSLLLWDYLDVPYSSVLPVELTADLQFLRDEGILRQTYVVASGLHVPQFIPSHTHIAAFSASEEAEPHKWSLGRRGGAPYLSREILEE